MSDFPAHADDDNLVGLLSAYQGGSLAAFEGLHHRLSPSLYAYFRSKGCASTQGADLVQETFLEIHRARRTYEPGRPVRAWVFGIARHVLLRNLDEERRRLRHETHLVDDLHPSDEAPSIEYGVSAGARAINVALHLLSPTSRNVWLMHHLDGAGFDEIAQRMGMASTAARLRSSRATSAIRRALGLGKDKTNG